MSATLSPESIARRTQVAFIATRLLGIPFWGLIYLLSVFLYKDLHISALAITAIIILKPMSALCAPYWSQRIYKRPDRIISNLVWANNLRYLPFLFIPWIDSAWVIIGAFALYMMLHRGVMPAWMEVVKNNLPQASQERLIAAGSVLDYCGTALLPLGFGLVLDAYPGSWRWLFAGSAALGLLATVFLYRIPLEIGGAREVLASKNNSVSQITKPWKEAWSLLKGDSSFLSFQLGFMLGGAGLMVVQPVLPMFFVDILELSYTKMLLALTLCKGVGMALTAPLCVRLFRRMNIFQFSALVTGLAALFPVLMIGSQAYVTLLYLAYGVYGVMQAGSELSWHMSGPIFAKEKESTLFSGTNVLTVGVRGCVVPLVGSVLYALTNSTVVMALGCLLSLLATLHFARYRLSQKSASS